MSKVVSWVMFYDDGSQIESATSTWADAPEDGVLEIVLFRDDGTRRMMGAHDWYWMAPDPGGFGWIYAHATNTTREEIEQRYPGAQIKRGRWVSDEHMDLVVKRALAFRPDGEHVPAN